jgi:hypothetical protein
MSERLHLPAINGPRAADYTHLRGNLVQRRTQQRSQTRHLARLQRIKPSIDNKPPGNYGHMAHNAKKAMAVDERYESIERSNRLLLGRLQSVMLNDQVL